MFWNVACRPPIVSYQITRSQHRFKKRNCAGHQERKAVEPLYTSGHELDHSKAFNQWQRPLGSYFWGALVSSHKAEEFQDLHSIEEIQLHCHNTVCAHRMVWKLVLRKEWICHQNTTALSGWHLYQVVQVKSTLYLRKIHKINQYFCFFQSG